MKFEEWFKVYKPSLDTSVIESEFIYEAGASSRQNEIDALKTLGEMADKRIEYLVIRNTLLQARLELAESNLKNSLGFIREEQSANDALQNKYDNIFKAFNLVNKHRGELGKRIDDSIALLQGKSIGEVYKAIRILKGDKND